MDWISVKDELPEKSKYVLVCWQFIVGSSRMRHMDIAFHVTGRHWSIGANKAVTHWMPLPEFPEEEETYES